MRLAAAAALVLAAAPGVAQQQEIQRALIQRDQQSAEFAARIRGGSSARLEQLHSQQLMDASRPLHPDPQIARELLPYQRRQMADERELRLPPPALLPAASAIARPDPGLQPQPLPQPGRTDALVDPIPAQGPGA